MSHKFSLSILALLFVFYCPIAAQQNFGLLNLKVLSAESNKTLQNVYIYFDDRIVLSDKNGELTLKLSPGSYKIDLAHIGYQPVQKQIRVFADSVISLVVKMQLKPVQLPDIEVEAERLTTERQMMKIGPGNHRFRGETIFSLPISLEPELLRVLSNLPGIHTTNELTTQLNVRGGTPDQNVFLLNGMRLFNLYHLVGLNGVIQPELINDVYFSSAVFPACYGNGLSSVIDVDTPKPGKKLNFEGGLSLVSSRLKTTIPLAQHTALTLSARHTYWNLILGKKLPYYFSDFFIDLQQEIGKKHYFQTSFFSSRDVFDRIRDSEKQFNHDDPNSRYELHNRQLFKWNTSSWMAKWQYKLNDNSFNNIILSYSEMDNNTDAYSRTKKTSNLPGEYYQQLYNLNKQNKENEHRAHNHFNQLAISWKLNFNKLQIGLDIERTKFQYWWYNIIEDETIKLFFDNAPENFRFNEDQKNVSGFFDWLWEPHNKLKFRTGLRTSYSPDYPILYWEPRLTSQYNIFSNFTLSLGLSRHIQTNATARERGLLGFLDLNFPLRDRPEIAHHLAASVKWKLSRSNEILIELYQKQFKDLLYADSSFSRQPGFADGIEVSWNHSGRKMKFNIFYTYSHSYREIGGYRYPSNYDMRHRIFFNVSLRLSQHWKLNISHHFHTGQPYDTGKPYHYYGRKLSYYFPEKKPVYIAILNDETDILRGSIRYPNYSRMDISLFYNFQLKKNHFDIFLSVINILNNRNLITYQLLDFAQNSYEVSSGILPPLNYGLMSVERLPILPSIGIQWKL